MIPPIQIPGRAVSNGGTAERPASDTPPSKDMEGTARYNPVEQDQWIASGVAREASQLSPGFDKAKVDAIKQAVQNGQYPLDARRMAESFLAMEQLINE